MGLSKFEANKAEEDTAAEEETKRLETEGSIIRKCGIKFGF